MNALSYGPLLVCLNIQQDVISGREHDDRAVALLWRMRTCVEWARGRRLQIVHVQSIDGYSPAPPIIGFEILPNEIVIAKCSASLFGADEWRRSLAAGADRVLLLGFSRACDIAASALDGASRNVQVVLVRDAIGLEASSNATPEALCELLSPVVGSVCANDLVKRSEPLIVY